MAKNIVMNYLNSDGSYEELYPENGCLPLTGGTITGSIKVDTPDSGGNGDSYQLVSNYLGEKSGLGHTVMSGGEGGLMLRANSANSKMATMLTIGNLIANFQSMDSEGYGANVRLTGIDTPVNDYDAVNKRYVDGLLSSSGGIEIINYVGNGGYGDGSPISITVSKDNPKYMIIQGIDSTATVLFFVLAGLNSSYKQYGYIGISNGSVIASNRCEAKISGKVVTWYSNDGSNAQASSSGVTYYAYIFY